MPWILTREDFQDPSVLRARLGLANIAEATTAALEVFCMMGSRLLGPASGLHENQRQLVMVRPAEEAKLKKEMEEVDNDVCAILDEVQEEAVVKAVEQEKNIISIEGPPGSGKTLIGKEILRRQAEKVKEETDKEPIVLLTGDDYTKEDYPLGKQLVK